MKNQKHAPNAQRPEWSRNDTQGVSRRNTWRTLLLAFARVALASSASAAPKKTSSADQRKEVSITVYNQNFGLVREVRDLDLGDRHAWRSSSATSPRTSSPRPWRSRAARAPARSACSSRTIATTCSRPQTLLEKYVGKKVRVYRYNEKLGEGRGLRRRGALGRRTASRF